MREINIDLSNLDEQYDCGNCGEIKASKLNIDISKMAKADFYVVVFRNSLAQTYCTDRFYEDDINDGILSVELWQDLTRTESERAVVEAYTEENAELKMLEKSAVINLHFDGSIFSDDALNEKEPEGLYLSLIKLEKNLKEAAENAENISNTLTEKLNAGEFNGPQGAQGPQGPPGKDAVTDTELSTDSDNAIANSTVSKVLAYGNLIGFEKISSYEEFEEFNAKYPVGVSEDDFLVLYITSDLSYSDINGSFDCPPGLYVITADNFFRLCPDAESVNSHFKNIEEMMSYWYALAASKANQTELDALKTNLDDVSDTADEALTVARGRNRALCFFTKQELDSWLNGEFQREDGKTKADLQVGDNLYIVEVGVPDYWWDGEQVRPLETQKVDLSEYAEKEYVDEKVEQEVSVPNGDIANYLDVADAIGLWKTVTANITNFDNMFQGRTDITKIPELDMSSATSAKNLCNGCSNLKSFVNRTTSNVTTFYSAFKDCTAVETIDIDTSKNTQFNGMFWNCSSLKELNIDMSRAAGMDYMCRSCTSLKSIKTVDFTGASPAASGKNYSNMFTYCPNLIHIEIVPESIKGNLSFVNSAKLDSESVANIFNGLADMSEYDTHTLTLHADVQITQAQADGAVAKNWNIVGGTVNG